MSNEIATDPPKSEAQRRAMWAAAEGRSTLGIPEKVGKEFVGADEDSNVTELPIIQFGDAPLPTDWPEDDQPDDDEELAQTPPDVVEMLGFDPLELAGDA